MQHRADGEAVHVGELHVQEQHVRLELARLCQRGRSVRRLADDLEPSASRIARAEARKLGWSSTIRTVVGMDKSSQRRGRSEVRLSTRFADAFRNPSSKSRPRAGSARACAPAAWARFAGARFAGGCFAAGSSTMKLEPSPGWDSTQIEPSIRRTSSRQM